MILVDIYVPVLNKRYDFKLDEHAYISHIAEEVGELIILKENSASKQQLQDLLLCDYQRRQVLPYDQTLDQNGIRSGSRLVLI